MERATNYKHRMARIVIAVGDNANDTSLKLPAGTCIAYAMKVYGGDGDANPIKLALKDGGNEIVEPLSQGFLEKTNGGRYVDSMVPTSFRCDINVEIFATAYQNMVNAAIIDVFFLINQDVQY
ncbi:MAG: hypothetical protein AAGF96_18875 [Bacteroidota bacterium]